jgi:diguanylate cyclase (GGDEF)-like protein
MMMETALRLQVTFLCLCVIIILWFSGDRRKAARMEPDSRLYRALLVGTAFMLAIDSMCWLFDGRPGSLGRDAVLAANSLYYIGHTIPVATFVLYSDFQIFREQARFSRLVIPLAFIQAFVAVLALLSPFNGILFGVDEANRYVRGPWFPAFAVTQYGLVAFVLCQVVHFRKRVSRRVFLSLLAYPLPMLIAAIAQMLFFGLVLIWPTTTLFLVVAAFNLENRRSKTDYLTGVANRRSLDEELERRVASCESGGGLCGLLLDIDDFKMINDRFGHEAGDRALEDVANILAASVRVDDCVARMGGDEFVVLADFREGPAMEELVRRVELAIGNHNASNRLPYRLSLSIGRLMRGQGNGATAAEFLASLDSDMYARKKAKAGYRPPGAPNALPPDLPSEASKKLSSPGSLR